MKVKASYHCHRAGSLKGRQSPPVAPICAAVLAASLTGPAAADEVIMQNGDRLTGKVVRLEEGELTLETAYAGTLSIDWSLVRECRLDEPAPLLLEDDEVIQVAGISRDGDRLQLRDPTVNESMTIAPDRVEVVNPEPWELGDGHRLNGAINIALQDESGNSDSTELDLDLTLHYRRRWHEFETYGQLENDTTRGEKTTDKWTLLNKYIRRFPRTPWYGAGWLRFKHDRFADVRLRTIVGPALGYRFNTVPSTRLSAEIGPIYIREDFYDETDTDLWGPGLFVDFEQDLLADRLEFYFNGMGFSSVSRDSTELWTSWTGLRMPLVGGLVSSLEYELDYDSTPAGDAKTTDETLRLKIGYQW
jgi:putative salt-induced outer membrane protein YdiY